MFNLRYVGVDGGCFSLPHAYILDNNGSDEITEILLKVELNTINQTKQQKLIVVLSKCSQPERNNVFICTL